MKFWWSTYHQRKKRQMQNLVKEAQQPRQMCSSVNETQSIAPSTERTAVSLPSPWVRVYQLFQLLPHQELPLKPHSVYPWVRVHQLIHVLPHQQLPLKPNSVCPCLLELLHVYPQQQQPLKIHSVYPWVRVHQLLHMLPHQ